MLQRAASNAYSWWWASHVRTKQSKWLDNHLQDMEHRVKCMLLLLGEEADSFSKRAEMYYKRRPEVITQVEEVYRAYRSLADRYDIMSGELHKANHTIATAFPDQVQYAILEEEDDNIPKAFTPVDPRKIHKSTVDGLMKKKKGEQPETMFGTNNTLIPINKENAREEIGRLQKEILVMQTEKEFIKSSYESGIAKYWDLEKDINEMQEQVCLFQDKFDESAMIEDDEARALMTTAALKSCEDTILKLQEQRKESTTKAIGESEKVKIFKDKLKSIMKEHGQSLEESSDYSHKSMRKNHGAEMDVYHNRIGGFEMQTIVQKIKEHFEKDNNISMVEFTEQIDELVNKVVDLELMVSSQTSQINRLCRENNELENSLQSLEEDNTTLGSGELNEKLKQVEEELTRVQTLESSFHKDESIIHSNFTETINIFSDILDMLLSPIHEHQDTSTDTLAVEEEASLEPSRRCSGDTDIGGFVDPSYELQASKLHEDRFELIASDGSNETKEISNIHASIDDATNNAQSHIEQDKGSREKVSLARLRHISFDNIGGYDDQEDMGKQGLTSPSFDGASEIGKLQEQLMSGLEDKEKVLLAEYTSLLKDYKDAKRRVTEVEKRNQEFLHEIRSLRELLNTTGVGGDKKNSSINCSSSIRKGHRRTPSYSALHQRGQSLSSISRLIRMGSTIQEGDENEESSDDIRLPVVAKVVSPLEERFRRDIDTLLEENLELWMKFSSSLQRVQEFQCKYEDMQSAIRTKQEMERNNNKEAEVASATVEKKLRALKTEVQVWSEQNAMLRGELQCRFTSLCDIQEEITAAVEMEGEEEGGRFTSYQAAKFQGEVLNMQQENNRVSDELQAGLDHVKGLQVEIEKVLAEKLHGTLSPAQDPKDGEERLERMPSKSKVPLQSFLFPSKNKKTSLFSRVTPILALQKQHAELRFRTKLPR